MKRKKTKKEVCGISSVNGCTEHESRDEFNERNGEKIYGEVVGSSRSVVVLGLD